MAFCGCKGKKPTGAKLGNHPRPKIGTMRFSLRVPYDFSQKQTAKKNELFIM